MEKIEISELTESFERYAITRFELFKMESTHRFSLLGSGLVSAFLLGIIAISVVLFLSIATGMYLSEKIGNTYAGFLLVAAFYMLAGILLYKFRKKWVIIPMRDLIIRKMYEVD